MLLRGRSSISGICGRFLRPSTGGGGGSAGAPLPPLHVSQRGSPGPAVVESSASNSAWQEGQATFMLPF